MKLKPIAFLLLGGVFAAGVILLVGKTLTVKAQALPPTGSSMPTPVRAPQPVEVHSWIDTGRRWGVYTEDAEWLQEPEETAPSAVRAEPVEAQTRSSFDKLRVTGQTEGLRVTGGPGALPTPGLSPPPSPAPSSVRGELAEPRTERREPTIRQVHLAATKYAEVMPEKIQHWRTLSQLRNFVPRFTLGFDRDRDTTIASSTSGGKTTFAVGPKDETLSVDFGFTWDLANLVWDSAQTSIDVRSRLMVQLRQDILEETTRIYFERQRLMAEFEANPASDPTLQRERSLRLQELTAQLDALTGGLYSENP